MDLYDTIWWWDDANHLVNWSLLSGAIGELAWRSQTGAWRTMAYVIGFGATTAILWEIAEYVAFIRNSAELNTAYVDTLGDLALGLTGSIVAGAVAALAPRRGKQMRHELPTVGTIEFHCRKWNAILRPSWSQLYAPHLIHSRILH